MAAAVNDLAARLVAALAGKPDKVPKGWMRREEMHKKLGRATSQADRMIKAGVAAGLLERKSFRIQLEGGLVRETPHWREVR